MRSVVGALLFAGAGFTLAADEPERYTFYPLGGILGQDVALSSTVDLDGTTAIRDFDCSENTYDGHRGIDLRLTSFRQQDFGVPVFAALDGTVLFAHDGEPDRRLDGGGFSGGNLVLLRHRGTHVSQYYHLRNGSVAVVAGQFVRAGTQLGLVASSGTSSWPHLHFQSENNGAVYEPHAGPCREGPSYWTDQAPVVQAFHVVEFGFSPEPYEQSATYEGVAEDREPRTGTYVQGSTIHFRFAMRNVPAQTSYERRLRRPDGTIAATRSNSYGNAALIHNLFSWGSFELEPSVPGEWSVELAFNGSTAVVAPFLVVATPSEIRNRAPHAVGASIEPARLTSNDVPRCEVETSLLFEDPDYDVMQYRYQWSVEDRIVREITSAGLMDALPRDVARPGDRVLCRVTPFDGALEGPSTSAAAIVGSLGRRRAARH